MVFFSCFSCILVVFNKEEEMALYKYKVLVQWIEGQKVSLTAAHDVETDLDHEKVDRIVRECLIHSKNILEIADE